MQLNDLILVSVDDHVIEPPDLFKNHLPEELKARAPHVREDSAGNNYWMFEDRVVGNVGLNAVAGRPPEEFGMEPTSLAHVRAGTYDIHKRIEDMNVNGILASMCFGTFPAFDGSFFAGAKDKALAARMIQAYNDWHIDEWAGTYKGRMIPLALVPFWDVDLTVAEVRRVVRKGCHAITFPDNPAMKGLPSLHNSVWDPLWKVCAEESVVICCHIGTGARPPHSSNETPIEAWITSFPLTIANSAADWLYLQAFQKYKGLKVALSEGGIGWIPYFLERADFTHKHHRAWTHVNFHGKLPSEVFREHFITCFIKDDAGLKHLAELGPDNVCYEADYPHSDCVWPRSPELLFEGLGGLSDEEINKVTHLNAMREFKCDPISLFGREKCTVGALREQAKHVDIEPRSYGGARPAHVDNQKPVTSGDVLKLFAQTGRDGFETKVTDKLVSAR
jgi:predicted TIM-barrel fold metal-dependent hydrolase